MDETIVMRSENKTKQSHATADHAEPAVADSTNIANGRGKETVF